ncbi:MAG: glycosyltransferase family 2 protein [Candidatus Taylorbacteria bacterium]|nr:glycosyltransferase family 2 protein [Candidatus Taylorbacteria bacterium]
MVALTNIPVYIFIFIGLYFQIFLLVTFLENEDKDDKSTDNENKNRIWPTVSVTIPCFNEQETVTGTILSLLNLEYPKDKLTILIVDDGSTDNTYNVAHSLSLKYPQIKLVRQKNGGKFTALNFGIDESKSEFIAGLDADSFVDPQALKNMIPYFDDQKIMAVTPAIRVYSPKTILQILQRAEYNFGIFGRYIMGKVNAIHVTPGPLSIFRKTVFDNLGKYKHAHNTEDMEIAFRMQESGYKIANCPNAFVYTVTPPTLKKLHIQRVRWMSGFLKNALDYKHLFFNRKYGDMGVFTLPFSFISIFVALYFFVKIIYSFGDFILQKIIKINTVGFSWNFHFLHFDWFFINTESIAILAIIIISIAFVLILLGKKMAEGTMVPSRDILYFMLFYSFISPFWLTKAVYNTVTSRATSWR